MKMKKRRILILALCAAVAFATAGCGKSAKKETTKQETEKTDNKKEKTEKAEKKDPSQEAYENFVSGIQKASSRAGRLTFPSRKRTTDSAL